MKKYSIIAFLLFVVIILPAQKTFKMIFSSPSYDKGVAAFRTSDKGYLIVGNTSGYGHGSSDVWVIALDSNASFLWQKTYGGSADDNATAAVITGNDELIITGTTTSGAASVNIFLWKLSPTGVPVLQKTFGGADWDFAESIAFVDSVYYICGRTFNGPSAGYYKAFVTALNYFGDTVFTKYGSLTAEEEYTCVKIRNDGNIILTGNSLQSDYSPDTAFVRCLDSAGNELWTRQLNMSNRSCLLSLDLNTDTSVVAVGYYSDTLYNSPLLVKFDKNGTMEWLRKNNQNAEAFFNSVEISSDGFLTIAGTSSYAGDPDFYLSRFISNGWWDAGTLAGGLSVEELSLFNYHDFDSTYLAVGTTKSFNTPGSAIILVQTDYYFNYDTTTQLFMVSGINNDILPLEAKVYPNPVSGILNVEFASDLYSEVNLSVYSSNGKIVKRKIVSSGNKKVVFSLIDLPDGVYFLSLSTSTSNALIKFIKKNIPD